MRYNLYVLKHPATGATLYVGVTTNPGARLSDHKLKFNRKHGVVPVMEVLMTFKTEYTALQMEKSLIDDLRKNGAVIYNAERYKSGGRVLGFEERIMWFERNHAKA